VRGEEAPVATDIRMTVEELKQQLDAKKDLFILDVREPHEYQICNLNGHLIPLGDLPSECTNSTPVATLLPLRSGVRSGRQSVPSSGGIQESAQLTGGILAWADKIDPKMPKY